MFARWLILVIKTGKKIEAREKAKQKILPLLEKCNGFFDLIALELEEEPLKVYAISLWDNKRSAEKYERESFAVAKHILEPFLVLPPVVKQCVVDDTICGNLLTAVSV